MTHDKVVSVIANEYSRSRSDSVVCEQCHLHQIFAGKPAVILVTVMLAVVVTTELFPELSCIALAATAVYVKHGIARPDSNGTVAGGPTSAALRRYLDLLSATQVT